MTSLSNPNAFGLSKPKSSTSSRHYRRWTYFAALLACTSRALGKSDYCSNPADWSNNLLPAYGADLTITPSDGVSRTITYDYTGPNITLNNFTVTNTPSITGLTLGTQSGSNRTYNLSGGTKNHESPYVTSPFDAAFREMR